MILLENHLDTYYYGEETGCLCHIVPVEVRGQPVALVLSFHLYKGSRG